MQKPTVVYLHPAVYKEDAIRAIEEATGRIAVMDRRRKVVRLQPALRIVATAAKQVSA
ncbi:hypothetical protein AAFM71_07570 [Chromobacterium violaceum]|uniref:hypothetical protein n=1 Tax=Chromobacterium violaceum TaxID=536 RepID=UPI001595C4A5|nr:hypothetical protein [Chromobacterium violaceum]